MNKAYKLVKCTFDKLVALFGLITLSPILVILSLAIIYWNGRPVIFTQERIGLNEKPFMLYKFRTMKNSIKRGKKEINLSAEDLSKLEFDNFTDGQRITNLGKLLRDSSLDELPTLFNVLLGDMSFVGPRPLLTKYLERYNQNQRRRHEVKPGITGWAQVNGRNLLSWEEKFDLDVWYIENKSLILDIKIFLKTIYKVLRREGISSDQMGTTKEFSGGDN